MESEITEQEFLNAAPSLAEPHFDEEATLLSARPVVPLDEIKANTPYRRPWVFGLAIAGALLLGITATAFYFSRQSVNDSKVFADSEAVDSGAEALATEPVRATNLRPTVAEAAPDPAGPAILKTEGPPTSQTSDSASRSQKQLARLVDVITSNPSRDRENEIRQERKAARQEEKERKREARREMRANKSSDELLRIREIFEGTRKP